MSLNFATDKNNGSQDPLPQLLLSLEEYFEINRKILSSFTIFKKSQLDLFDLMNGKFEIFDIIIRGILLSNKTRKKKYYDLYQEESSRLLEKTATLFHFYKSDNLTFDTFGEKLGNLSKEIMKMVDILGKKNCENNENNGFLKPKQSFRKRESYDDIADVKSSRRDMLSSNRVLISAKNRAIESVLAKENCVFAAQKTKYFNERTKVNPTKVNDFAKSTNEKIQENLELAEKNNKNDNHNVNVNDNDENNKNGAEEGKKNNLFTPKQEKKIILDLMKKEYGIQNQEVDYLLCHQGE